jgi:hypothetical protein
MLGILASRKENSPLNLKWGNVAFNAQISKFQNAVFSI